MAPGPITYRMVMFRPLVFVYVVVLGLAGVALVLNLLGHGEGPGVVFVVLWLAIYLWISYWYLFRISYEVGVVDGSILRWRTITSSHEVPLMRVKEIRPPRPPLGVGLKEILIDGDRSPLIVANQGYRDVVGMIVQFRPDLVIRDTWYDRLFERYAQRSVRWRRL
jgi:hypothetical protein